MNINIRKNMLEFTDANIQMMNIATLPRQLQCIKPVVDIT